MKGRKPQKEYQMTENHATPKIQETLAQKEEITCMGEIKKMI